MMRLVYCMEAKDKRFRYLVAFNAFINLLMINGKLKGKDCVTEEGVIISVKKEKGIYQMIYDGSEELLLPLYDDFSKMLINESKNLDRMNIKFTLTKENNILVVDKIDKCEGVEDARIN